MIRKHSNTLFSAALILLLASCKSQTVWKMPLENVRANLESRSYEFLQSVTFADYPEREVLKLGPEAPFYLALILSELNRQEASQKMLRFLAKRGSPLWRAEAVNLLLKTLIEHNRYEEAEDLASVYLKRKKFPQHHDRIKKMYVESLYWQRRDQEVLTRIEDLFTEAEISDEAELTLFRSVSACRLDAPGWTARFGSLFLNHPLSTIHVRAYGFLEQEPARLARFSPQFRTLLHSKYLLASGKNPEGAKLFSRALLEISETNPEALTDSEVIRELGYAHLLAGTFIDGAKLLEDLASRLERIDRLHALEMAGRLYRKAGLRLKGIELLKTVSAETTDPKQKDRSLWFALDMSLSLSTKEGTGEIQRTIPEWSDSSYFDDLLDRLISILIERGDGQGLLELYHITHESGSPYITSRLYFILLRMNYKNLPPPVTRDHRRSAQTANALVRSLYYEYLVSHMQGKEPAPLVGQARSEPQSQIRKTVPGKPGPDPDEILNTVVMGYFDYGLYREGYKSVQNALRQNAFSVPQETLLRSADRLEKMGYFTEGMRLMNHYLVREEQVPSSEDWKLAYPLAFKELIEKTAAREEVPDWLLFSVIREESYFDPVAGSTAGAVGLMQLMSETAQDMARLLRMKEYDLNNPEHSLRLGTRYLVRLHKRFESWPRALMAYNAGPTRARRWGRIYGGLTEEMIAESIPLPETRHFVRKVLVSAAMYTLLYGGDTKPQEVIRLFFPSLEPEQEKP